MKNKDTIEHFGIKGMKWGLRRKKHMNINTIKGRDSTNRYRHWKKQLKRTNEMNDKELSYMNRRMRLELDTFSNLRNYRRNGTLGYIKRSILSAATSEFIHMGRKKTKSIIKNLYRRYTR